MKLIIGDDTKEKVLEVSLEADEGDINILVGGHLVAFLSPEDEDKPRLYIANIATNYVKFGPEC